MKNYRLNIENANAEVLKWLDDTANRRVHQTTLQIPFDLLAQEQPHLLSVPKPYHGIHPKVVIESVSKNTATFNRKVDMNSIYIPNRDMQNYDDLIPAVALYMLPSLSMSVGGAVWI